MEEREREEFLTARQLAKVLQVSESTVRRLARTRRIPSVRVTPHIIRFHLDAVREALDVPRHRIRHGEYVEPVDDAQLSFEDLAVLSLRRVNSKQQTADSRPTSTDYTDSKTE